MVSTMIVTGTVGYWGYRHYQRDQQLTSLRAVITSFAEASDTADAKKLATLTRLPQFVGIFRGSTE
jgi:hypothetical protein